MQPGNELTHIQNDIMNVIELINISNVNREDKASPADNLYNVGINVIYFSSNGKSTIYIYRYLSLTRASMIV